VPVIGKVAIDTQYELKGIDPAKQTAQLGIVQELTLMEAAGGAALATVDYTGKLTGTAEWDLARGHCIGAHLTGKVTDIRKTATGEAVSIEETVELTMQRVRLAMPQNHGRDARATPEEHRRDAGATAKNDRQDAGPTSKPEPALSEVGPDGSPVIAYLGQRALTISQLNDEMARLLKNRPAPTTQVRDRMRRQARSVMLLRTVYENYLAEHPELVTAADLDQVVGQMAEIAKKAGLDAFAPFPGASRPPTRSTEPSRRRGRSRGASPRGSHTVPRAVTPSRTGFRAFP